MIRRLIDRLPTVVYWQALQWSLSTVLMLALLIAYAYSS